MLELTLPRKACTMARHIPEFTPETFGTPQLSANTDMKVFDVPACAPAPKDGVEPSIVRLLEGDGGNLVCMRFRPGQSMHKHSAVHPIVVQCVKGRLRYGAECGCGHERDVELTPGVVAHVPAHLVHWIEAPEDNEGDSIFLLTMLTGEKHSGSPEAGTEHAEDPGADS